VKAISSALGGAIPVEMFAAVCEDEAQAAAMAAEYEQHREFLSRSAQAPSDG
jgi:hypothetical protein